MSATQKQNTCVAAVVTRTAAKAAAVALLIGLGGTGPASAQDWKAEWQRVVAAAEQEGTVVLNTQPNKRMRAYVFEEWRKAFPNIKLSMTVVPGSKFLARIKTEREAGKYLWDMGFSGPGTGLSLKNIGVLEPFMPQLVVAELKDPDMWDGWDKVFYDTERKYVFSVAGFLKSPFYNAKQIAPEKVKKLGFNILLDPAYAGKIVWHDPAFRGSGQSYAYVLRRGLGDEGLRKLIVDQKVRFVAKQHEVTEALARGTAWIGIGPIVTSLLEPYKKAGLDLDVRAFGNGPEVNEMSTGGSTLFVYKDRPHPNATKVFINWLLSKDIQAGLGEAMQMDARRQDVPSTAGPDRTPIKGAKYLATQREEYVNDVRQAIKFIAEIRKGMN